MRTLVTGATGFLGGHLTRRLLQDAPPVRILARDAAAAQPLVDSGAELVLGAMGDRVALECALDGVTTVYHLAGRLFIPGVPASEYFATHVDGTRLLLDYCARAGTITRFVHCSTTGVLGATGSQSADETAPYQPTNAYEASKMEGEKLVRERMAGGFPAVVVRPGLVYGPGDLHLLGFFRAIERGRFRPIGRAPIWVHPIFIDDMSEALARCGRDARAVGECFHIAGREPVTLATLAATIASSLGVAIPRGHIPLAAASAVAVAGDLLPASLR
ncbi:MAG TPA: NAD-dependent epimerase/dehydratase family protein, partial [Ktedonobacterales bacterium]|nr:NAD-dependent epimerase/dehydratase family protein [Ktedonobacterales bacterium]